MDKLTQFFWTKVAPRSSARGAAYREFARHNLSPAESLEVWQYGRTRLYAAVFFILGDIASMEGVPTMLRLIRAGVSDDYVFGGMVNGAVAASMSPFSPYAGNDWRTAAEVIALHEEGIAADYAKRGRGLETGVIIAAHNAGVPEPYLLAAARAEVDPVAAWEAGVPFEYMRAMR